MSPKKGQLRMKLKSILWEWSFDRCRTESAGLPYVDQLVDHFWGLVCVTAKRWPVLSRAFAQSALDSKRTLSFWRIMEHVTTPSGYSSAPNFLTLMNICPSSESIMSNTWGLDENNMRKRNAKVERGPRILKEEPVRCMVRLQESAARIV